MGCLADLIGIDKACGSTPGVIYVGDVGMTEKELSDYISGDDQNVSSFLAARAAHAERYVISDVLNHFRSVIRPWTFIADATVGDPDPTQELMTADAGTIGGMVVEVDARKSNVKLVISRLSIWTDLSSAFIITIRDLADGSIITTATLAAPTANAITYYTQSIEIPIRKRCTRLLITHSLASYYRTTAGAGACSSCRGTSWRQGVAEVYGARIASGGPFIRTEVDATSYTSGLGMTFTVECDHSAWLCEHKSMMAMPMLYKTCEEAVKVGYFNVDRMNTRSDQVDKARERQNYFAREYGKLMDDVWKNIPLPRDQECFVCNTQTRVTHTLP